MTADSVVFAIPGNLEARTGGYLYDRKVITGLRTAGWSVEVLPLAASFPCPTSDDMRVALEALASVSAERVLLIDGLAYGALETEGLRTVNAPICALVHHPLALESGLPTGRASELRAREKANLALAAHVVVTSPHTAADLTAEFGIRDERTSVALPGTEPPSGKRLPIKPPLILAVGSLTERKGHDVLLDALARITDSVWTAEIVGGPYDPKVARRLVEQCKALGLDRRVSFVGELDARALDRRYRQASLFALATRYEGYGMVFAEATAHGLPIVSCAVGAVPDTAPAKSSLLVPAENAPSFADALRMILTDRGLEQRLAAAAINAAATLPTWDETVAQMAKALDRAARQRERR